MPAAHIHSTGLIVKLAAYCSLAFLFVVVVLPMTAGADTVRCPNGAAVDVRKRCDFFANFEPEYKKVDERIIRGLKLKPGEFARSIAVIIGISAYDNQVYNVPAAHADVVNLKSFLIANQHFDEVIVLENKDATIENIRYFLREYALNRTNDYQGRVRFLFAYSGHGIPVQFFGAANQPDSRKPSVGLALAAAKSDTDYANIYGLNELRALFNDLAKNTYHFLALINACYGGDVFAEALTGGSTDDFTERGAHAITAGPDDKEVYSSANAQGSLFFDAIRRGVETGDADLEALQATLGVQGSDSDLYGIVRLGELDGYLRTQINKILKQNPATAPNLQGNLHHWIGSVEPFNVRAEGGFFFLSTPPAGKDSRSFRADLHPGKQLTPSTNQLFGGSNAISKSGSTLWGSRVASIFNKAAEESTLQAQSNGAPVAGPVRGIDVSHFDGEIDWKKVAAQNIKFAYVKASESSKSIDPKFNSNWRALAEVAMARGAYHTFSFCFDPKDQFANLNAIVPHDSSAMPLVVDIELIQGQDTSNIPALRDEGKCGAALGPSGIRSNLSTLLNLIEAAYAKRPIIYGSDDVLDKVLTAEFTGKYGLWRRRLGLASTAPPPPWVIWQYTENAKLDGIQNAVDENILSSDVIVKE